MKSKNKSLKVNTFLNAFRMTLTVISPLITFPYISRIFSTDGIGALNYAQSISGVFVLIASLGIYTYGVREGAKVRNDYERFSQLATELLIINFVAMLFSYVFYAICVYGIESLYPYHRLLIINGLSIFFTALGLDWIFGVYEEYKYITIRQIVSQIATLVLMFCFVRSRDDIYVWALITVACNALCNIWNWISGSKYFRLEFSRISKLGLLKHIKPILVLFATRIAATLYTSIDTVMLGSLVGDSAVGLYSAATKVNTILITFFSAMSPVFIPRIIDYLNNDIEKYYALTRKIFNAILILAIPLVVGIELLSNDIVLIIAGEDFRRATATLRIIAPIVLINACLEIIYYDIWVPLKKENLILLCTIASIVTNIIISTLMIPTYAETGAAIGSLISEICTLLLAVLVTMRMNHEYRTVIPSVWKYLLSTLLMSIVVLIVHMHFSNMLLSTALAITFGVIAYFSSVYLLKDRFFVEMLYSLKNKFVNKKGARKI